jgi:hypothetical protein
MQQVCQVVIRGDKGDSRACWGYAGLLKKHACLQMRQKSQE